jgi:hypothetical protein
MTYTEDEYPFLVNEVMKHISAIKKDDPTIALLDIIYDYCFKNGIAVELVGDAIASDVYFKSFIEKDCQLHRILPGLEEQSLDEW